MTNLRVRDEGSGPAVMLLHAFPCDNRMWDGQVPAIVDAGWRVLVPDLPGFGESPLVESQEPNLESIVDALIDVALERGVDRLVVVGLSVGGYLVMDWLRRRPEMLAGIGLCDTKATDDGPEGRSGREALASAMEDHPEQSATVLRERILPVLIGSTSHDSRSNVVAQVTDWMEVASPATVAWYQRAMANRPDSREVLAAAQIPALVLWGGEDVMSPEGEQRLMLDALRDVRGVEVPGAGHLSAIEQPDLVTGEIVEFLTRIRRASISG